MIADIESKGRHVEWADHVLGVAARIAHAGSTFGYEKIVAARIWLAERRRLPATGAAVHKRGDQPCWSRTRKDELAGALDEWENEGGGISR